MDDGEEDLDPENTNLVLNTVLITIDNELEHQWLDDAVRLLNAHPIHQSIDDCVPDHKYSIPGLPGTKFLAHQVRVIWFIVRRWVWDTDMPGELGAGEMGLGKTVTSVAAAMICKLLNEKVVMGLLLSILWGNTIGEWVHLAQNDFPAIIGDEQQLHLLRGHNSVHHRLSEIQSTPPQGHAVQTLGFEPILVETMPGVAETFTSVIDEMTYGTIFNLINLLHTENANLKHEDLNNKIHKPEHR